MFKKLLTISLILAFASLAMAQNTMLIKPSGETIKLKEAANLKEAIKVTRITNFQGVQAKSVISPMNIDAAGKADTITYRKLGGTWNTNFGFFDQDVMFTWYEAIADMTIQGIGYTCSDDEGSANATVSLRLIKLNWTAEQMKDFEAATAQGYYPSTGDGFNEVDPFGEEATGNWIALDSANMIPPWADNADPGANTWDYDLWSDGGFAWPTTAVASELADPVYNWLLFDDTGLGDADVKAGEVFAVVAINDGTVLDANRIGFWSDNTIGVPTWKFYENGRSDPAVDPGWWVRMYTWDFVVAVDITGDTPPEISNVTELGTTLSTADRTVEATIIDENPGGGDAGVQAAALIYTIDGGNEVLVSMTANGDVYSAIIPGQQPGTVVSYSISATDVGGLLTKWARTITYRIYLPTPGETNLVVFNGLATETGYPQSYYWGQDSVFYNWHHDTWSYGALTADLIDLYDNIFEITQGGPADRNDDAIRAWLGDVATRNYLIAGDEYLGWDRGYADMDFAAGTFEYDILGITHSYNDVSYDGTAGQGLPSKFTVIAGTTLGDSLHARFNANPTDSLQYDPVYEIGVDNWHDGFDVVGANDVVFMTGETRGIGSAAAVQEVNVGVSNETAAGNKIVFMSYDPLAVNSSPAYTWYGFASEAPQVQALHWFEADVVGVDEESTLPEVYKLSQNYPNPFNPTTVISYSIPEKADVTLKVFNLLGQQVATLVNGVQNVGTHEVNFNASNMASGVYFYTIKAGQFTSTRKMMLIK